MPEKFEYVGQWTGRNVLKLPGRRGFHEWGKVVFSFHISDFRACKIRAKSLSYRSGRDVCP